MAEESQDTEPQGQGQEDGGGGARVRLAAAATALVVGGGLVALALAGQGGAAADFGKGQVPVRQVTDMSQAVERAGCEVRDFDKEGDGAQPGKVDYRSDPPHSGAHSPEPALERAYYDRPPTDETIVHSLRHGRIAIWFADDLDDEDKDNLKALFDEDSFHMILLPDDTMPYEVAATGWTHRLVCKEMSDEAFDAMRAFRDAWRDRAPEFVP